MKIRPIDTMFGALFILIAGIAATYTIVNTVNNIPVEYLVSYQEGV